MNLNNKVSEYINKASEEQVIILETIRNLVHKTVENVSEEIKWGFPVFAQGKDFAYM